MDEKNVLLFGLSDVILFYVMATPFPGMKLCSQDDSPPVYLSVEDLAGDSSVNQERYKNLVAGFQAHYGYFPSFLTRAPGRVNIIGEHVDYSGFGVLPMAIEQDVAIASRPNDTGKICFFNLRSECYPEYTCPVEGFEIDKESIVWYSYILCGIKGMAEKLNITSPLGMDLAIEGNIPAAAGLSSSSALVCCAALTMICINKVNLPGKKELADMCAKSERFIGTEGGGMDQAISFLGEPGKAFMIQFNPIRPSEVKLPDSFGFVISNTLVSSCKAAECSFNTRVAECHVAASVMGKKRGLDWRKVNRLGLLVESLGLSLPEMSGIVAESLHIEPYSREEICKILEISDDKFMMNCLSAKSKDVQSFKLYDRAMHVYEEANRVLAFKSACEFGPVKEDMEETSPSAVAMKLGRLMDESHKSCSSVYECSCEELDEIVALAKASGALGSRLTGAGWGGSAVSLVGKDSIGVFLEKIEEGYYKKHDKTSSLASSLFVTKPGPGAAICQL